MTCFTVNIYRNSQHYRESDVPCRQSAVFYHQNDKPGAPGGPPASHGGENRGQAPPKQTPEHGFGGKSLGVTSETQVAQFACGTPILRHWTVKTQHNDGPEAPAGPPASHGSKNPKKAPPKCTPESGFGSKGPRRRSAGSGPPPRRPTPHRRIGVPHAIRTQGTAALPHAASELGRPSELQYIYIYVYVYIYILKLRWSPLIIDAARRNDSATRQRQCLPARGFLVAGP